MSATPPTLYIADPTDETLTTRWVDLNAQGAFGIFKIVDGSFDLGEVDPDVEWIGDVQARVHHPPTEMSMRLTLAAASVANLQSNVEVLNQALDQPGVIVINMGGFSDTEYIDYYRSPLTRLFRAEDRNLFRILNLLRDPAGLPIRITRAAARRKAIRLAADNYAVNSTLAEPDNLGIPVDWTWLDGSTIIGHTFSSRFRSYVFQMDTAGVTDSFSQVVDIPDQIGATTWTFSFEVAMSWAGTLPVARAEVDWLDVSENQVGDTLVGDPAGLLFTPGIGFSSPKASGIAPSGSTKARLRMVFSRPAPDPLQTVYLRGVMLRPAGPSFTLAQPYRVEAQSVSNLSKRAWLVNTGNTEALLQTRLSPETGSLIERVSLARRSGFSDLWEFGQIGQGRFVDAILGTGASTETDPDASEGEAVKIVHTAGWSESVRVHVTQIDPSTLQGRHVIKVAMRLQTAVDSYQFRVRWGLGDVATLPFPGQVIPADTTDVTEAPYVSVPLCPVNIPHGVTGLYFSIESRADDAAETYLDSWWLEPQSEQVTVARVPGIARPGEIETRRWKGEDLATPPDAIIGTFGAGSVLESGDMLLQPDSPDQAAGTDPFVFEAVRHQITADLTLFNDKMDNTGDKTRLLGYFRLHNITTDTQVAQVRCLGIRSEEGTIIRWRDFAPVIKFKPNGTDEYVAYVVEVADSDPPNNIHIHKIIDTFIPEVSGVDGQTLCLDGDTRRPYISQDGEFAGALDMDPPFPDGKPGLQLFRVELNDPSPTGWDAVFPFPVEAHVADRSATLALNVVPRIK